MMADFITIGRFNIARDIYEEVVNHVMSDASCSREDAETWALPMHNWNIEDDGVSYAIPVRYLVGIGARAAIQPYLGFGAWIIESRIRPPSGPRRVTDEFQLIEIPAQHAEWMAMRLQSGMRGGRTMYETIAEAKAEIDFVS